MFIDKSRCKDIVLVICTGKIYVHGSGIEIILFFVLRQSSNGRERLYLTSISSLAIVEEAVESSFFPIEL